MSVYENMEKYKLEMITDTPVGGEYVKVRQCGNLLYVSGQGPIINGIPVCTGKLGELSIEQGQEAARICALNILGCLHEYLGDLNKVKNIIKLLAFVACTDDFNLQPQVVNEASKVFIQVFGGNGKHARSAIGTNNLPGNIPVEVEAIFEI